MSGVFSLLDNPAMSGLEHVIGFTGDRMKVFANNIANVDTPNFRMRDLNVERFDATLGRAIRQADLKNPNLPKLNLPRLERIATEEADPRYGEDLRGIVFHDDNDRSIEKLMVKMYQNQSRQGQATTLLRKQIELLEQIINETPA